MCKSSVESNFLHFNSTRYQPSKLIGRGACGLVYSGHDQLTNAPIAIKKIVVRDDFCAKRTLREIQIQKAFRHDNVLGIIDLIYSPQNTTLYCVIPKMDTDLGRVIRSQQQLSKLHVQYFTEQLLDGLAYLHECCNVMHRDLKPANLLVNESCELRISDFGLARLAPDESASHERSLSPRSNVDEDGDSILGNLTSYVVTRWYRAPELVLSSRQYSKAVDLWSVGCILAELLQRKPLFPGKSHVDQLNLIIDVLGSPEPEALEIVSDGAKRYVAGLPYKLASPLGKRFPMACAKSLSLLKMLLVWDPQRRATVRQALNHPYIALDIDPGCAGCVKIADSSEEEADPFVALQREVVRFQDEKSHEKLPSNRDVSPTPTGNTSPASSQWTSSQHSLFAGTSRPPAAGTSYVGGQAQGQTLGAALSKDKPGQGNADSITDSELASRMQRAL